MDNNIRNNVFATVNQNNFTAGADFGSSANCLDEFNDTATAFRSAAIAFSTPVFNVSQRSPVSRCNGLPTMDKENPGSESFSL